MKFSVSPLNKMACVFLATLLVFSSCASHVVITKPYNEKLRIGDGVKLTVKDGTIHSGRIAYIDRGSVVIRTPKQKTSESPVQMARFGTTIPWSEVVRVQVSGTLDIQNKLISNEEIRVNRRTNNRRNLGINVGLLGASFSFLTGAYLQDKISPATTNISNYRHSQGRTVFWSTFLLGTLGSLALGYKWGDLQDRKISIARIERQRENVRQAIRRATEAQVDSLNKAEHLQEGTSQLKF